jgi:hypothetical protein
VKELATPDICQILSSLALVLPAGIALLTLASVVVNRPLRLSLLPNVDVAIGERPDTSNLIEQRTRETIEDVSIAASLPVPSVALIEGKNAGAVGKDIRYSTLLIEPLATALTTKDLI